MGITNSYVAYCFDEAITQYVLQIANKKKPIFFNKTEKRDKSYNPGLNMLLKK